MREDLGRFFEGRQLSAINLLKTLYDAGTGQGADVTAWVDGRELVFTKGEAGKQPGFMRVLPHELWMTVSIPRGEEIPDPLKRMGGVRGSRPRLPVRDSTDIDPYFRRILAAAYSLG